MEQPRRKIRGHEGGPNRRMNVHHANKPHPANAIFKDAFGSAKIGKSLDFFYLCSPELFKSSRLKALQPFKCSSCC